jgi:hypothetical protein
MKKLLLGALLIAAVAGATVILGGFINVAADTVADA